MGLQALLGYEVGWSRDQKYLITYLTFLLLLIFTFEKGILFRITINHNNSKKNVRSMIVVSLFRFVFVDVIMLYY